MFFDNFNLPVASISVQCGSQCGITLRIDSFVHAGYRIRVPNGYCIELTTVHADSESSVFLCTNTNGDTHSVLASLITCIAHISLITCSLNSRAQVPAQYGAKCAVVYLTKIAQLDVSLPWLDRNVPPTYVEILTTLIWTWLIMQCNRLTLVSCFAHRFLLCRVVRKIRMLFRLICHLFDGL